MLMQPLRQNARQQQVSITKTLPAPVEGWDSSTALAQMKPLRAVQLKNWFPQPGYVEIRRGYQAHGTGVGTGSTAVETLMTWNGQSSSKMFAAGGGTIYDVTVAGAGSSSLTTLSEDRWQWINYVTSAGTTYLYCVNGTDSARHYNGSAWAAPAITGVSSTDLIHISQHKKRIWFVEKDSMSAWYLAADAVAGAATEFSVGGLFDQGGYLVATHTWTVDGGAGIDDLMVFISSKGQVAIYQGTDPAASDTWALIGVYNLPAPIGRRCVISYGSQPLIITTSGVLQLGLSLKNDKSQLDAAAITTRILQAMHNHAKSYSANFGWELCAYTAGTRLILNIPTSENSVAEQFVMNSLTGAWCEFDNHNANTWVVFNERLYFGGNTGTVYRADYTSGDVNTAITATGQTAYVMIGRGGQNHRYSMVQPLIYTDSASRLGIGVSVDFVETFDLSSPSGDSASSAQWDVAVWDVDEWGGGEWGGGPVYRNDWVSTPAIGRFASVKFKAVTNLGATTGLLAPENVIQVNSFVLLAEPGGVL